MDGVEKHILWYSSRFPVIAAAVRGGGGSGAVAVDPDVVAASNQRPEDDDDDDDDADEFVVGFTMQCAGDSASQPVSGVYFVGVDVRQSCSTDRTIRPLTGCCVRLKRRLPYSCA